MRKSFTHRFLLDPCNPCWHPFPHWSPVKASSREKVFYREKIFCREKVFIREKVQPRKRFSSQEKVFNRRKDFSAKKKFFNREKFFLAGKKFFIREKVLQPRNRVELNPKIRFHTPNFLNLQTPHPFPLSSRGYLQSGWNLKTDICVNLFDFLPNQWSNLHIHIMWETSEDLQGPLRTSRAHKRAFLCL